MNLIISTVGGAALAAGTLIVIGSRRSFSSLTDEERALVQKSISTASIAPLILPLIITTATLPFAALLVPQLAPSHKVGCSIALLFTVTTVSLLGTRKYLAILSDLGVPPRYLRVVFLNISLVWAIPLAIELAIFAL